MGKVAVGVQNSSSSFVGLATPLQLSVTLFCMGVKTEKSEVPVVSVAVFRQKPPSYAVPWGGVAAPQVGNGFICSVSSRGSCLS